MAGSAQSWHTETLVDIWLNGWDGLQHWVINMQVYSFLSYCIITNYVNNADGWFSEVCQLKSILIDLDRFSLLCQGKSEPCICSWVIPPRVKMRIRAQLVIDNQAISMQMPKPEVQSQMYNQDETCVCVQAATDQCRLPYCISELPCYLLFTCRVFSAFLEHQWCWSNSLAHFRRTLFSNSSV